MLPEHLLLAGIVALLVLEIARAGRVARYRYHCSP